MKLVKKINIKLIVLCAAMVAVTVIFSACGCTASENQNYITRAEWIALLGENFELSTFEQETPYFKDVFANHTSFTYVQACREWKILRTSKSFNPDKPATREFVAETAVLAALLDYDASFGGKNTSELLRYAVQNGIVVSGKADDKMTASECQKVIERTKKYYLSLERPEYANIDLKDAVVDYSASTDVRIEDDTVVMPADIGAEIEEGTIVIIPGDAYGTAVKVTSIETVNGETVIETITPELEEVFDELEFSFTASPKIEDIIPLQEGITITPLDNTTPVSSLSTNTNEHSPFATLSTPAPLASGSKDNPISFGVNINFTSGTLTANAGFTEYFSVEAERQYKKFFGETISEDSGEFLKKSHTIMKYDEQGDLVLEKREQWSEGYTITGNLSVKNLYVEVTGSKDLKKFSCELHFEIESSLSVRGKLGGYVPIYETVIPGPWGIWTKVVFSVYVDVNGELTIGAEIEHTTNVTYKNSKFKTVQDTDFEPYISISAGVSSGIKGEVIPTVLGIELFDVTANAGAELRLGRTLHVADDDAMICLEGKASFPIVNISIGANSETLANKLGIRATFKLVGPSGALIKSFSRTLWHYEITANGANNVDKCTWGNVSSGNEQEPTVPVVGPTEPDTEPDTEPTTPNDVPIASIGLEFALNDDGKSYSVAGKGACTDNNIVIPSTFNGLPVTAIGNRAFQNCTFTSVTIGDGVMTIGDYAFLGCANLTNVTIGNSVTTIGVRAFCECTSLTDVTIGGNVTTIGNRVFYGCTSLTKVTISESVTTMGYEVFFNCRSLTSVTIGNSVTTIGNRVFFNCDNLISIIIPNSVISIGEYVFGGCHNLVSVTVGDSVTTIGRGAFSNCDSLTSMTYIGTTEQWKNITFGNSWNYDAPATEVICSDGTVSLK